MRAPSARGPDVLRFRAQPWVSDINESAIWDMVLRAAASSVSQKAAARGKPLRGTRGGDDASSVSARSAVSSASAGTRASSSSATSRGSGASLAASLSSSVSSLMGSKGRAAKRAPALDSGPRPRQRAGLPDLPEDELAGADSADGAHSTAVSGAAVAGAPAESRDSRPASDMHLKLAKLGGDSFPGSRRGASLGSSAILSAPKPLESAALPACAASEDEEADDDFGDAFVATDVLTPRSSRSNKSSSSVRCQQLPQAPEHLARKAEEGGSSRSSRFSPAPGGQDARALLQQSRQVLEHARHKRQPPPPPPPLREQRDTSSDVAAPKVSHTTEVPEEQDSARDAGAGRGGGAGGGAGVVARNHGGGRGLDVGPICPDANQVDSRMDSDSMDRDEGSIDPRASACGRSESGFSVLNDVMTQYTESEAPSDADNDDSSVDESDDGRVEQERQEFFREAFCLRGSDSEDDLTDLDQKLEARDAFESRRVRVRRVRRFYRRKVAVTAAPWTWGSGTLSKRAFAWGCSPCSCLLCVLPHPHTACASACRAHTLTPVHTAGFHWCLGHGTHVDEKYPRMLRSLRNKGIIQMAAGGQHVAALSSSGQVFTWGVGMYGRLGHASMQDSTRPMLMDVTKKDCQAAQVACGHMHSAFVTTQGEVWCWGMGLYGELGLDDRYDHWLPQQVSELKGLYVTHVACGEHFTLACTGAGASYSWGRGKYGCLGLGDREDRLKPVQLRALSRVRVVRVIAGKSNPLALSDDGKLYSWGRGKFGAHGHGHTSHVLAPRKLPLPEDRIVVDMDCGRHHCAMLTIKGEVWCWGGGQGFALGNGKEEDSGVPIRVESIRKFVIIQVACGGNRTAAVARGGNLYMWGGGTTVSDPQRFSDLSGHYGKLHVNEEGGVLDPQPTRSYLTQLREEFAQGSGELFADAQADKFPRDLLKAALNEEISPAPLLRLRFELVQGAAEAVARFGLKEKLLQGLPLIHPEWAEGGLLGHDEQDNPAYREPAGMQCREEAASGQVGGLGSGSPGSKEIFRLQQALMLMESRHPDTQEAMAVETRVAREVLQLSMRLAPTLPLDDEVYPSSAHVPVLAQGHRSAAGRRGTADDDTDSVVSAGSWRSARSRGSQRSNAASTLSFAGGFDLSAALETTQHALFGAPTPSASAVAGKPAQSLPGAPLPRALVAQQQPAGPAHVPLTDDEAGRRGSSVDGINSHQGSAKRGSEEAGMGLEEDGNDSGEEGTADRDRWADAEPDLVWSDDDNDAASEAGSSRSHWSTSERKRGQLSEAAQVRQALSRPRLLRQLHEQVVAVVLGDGFSIALCNKNEASSGVIAAQEIRVSSKVRHEARVAQRSFEEKHGNIAATAAGAEEGSSVGSYAALSSASRIEKLSEGVKTVKRGRRIAGAQEKKRKEDGGSEDEGSNMDHVQVTAGRQSVGHSGQEPCTGASAAGSDGGDAGGGGKDAINECEIAVALVSTPRRPETADACAGQMEGHEDVVGESRAPKEKRKKSGSASRAKALKARTVDAQGQEPVREILQGWMLVHETVQQVRLPSYITRHLEEPAMKWDQRWMVLNNNELLIFQSPEEAQPLGKVVLDGYFASDYTAESHWGGHLGTPPRKKGPGECRIPTLELKPNFLFSSGPNNARHLYCRVKDSDELSKWLHALSEAAVLRMVRNTFTPLDIRPWDADVDWSVPDATAAWDAWRDIDEKESRRIAAEAGAVDSGPCAGESGELKQGALDVECGPGGRNADVVKAGGTEGAAAASAAGESAAGSGQGLAGMVAGLVAGVAGVAGITPREGSVTARSQATSDSGSASTKTVAAAGPAGSVTGKHPPPQSDPCGGLEPNACDGTDS